MSGRRLQAIVAVVLAGLWGAGLAIPHMRGDAWFLERVEATMADLRTLVRGVRKPPPSVLIVAMDDEFVAQEGKYPVSRGTLARIIDAVAPIFAEGRGARRAASRRGRRSRRRCPCRRAGTQPQRDRRRCRFRRGQAEARPRWRRGAGAHAHRRSAGPASRPLCARSRDRLVNVATDYRRNSAPGSHGLPHQRPHRGFISVAGGVDRT